MLGVNPYMASSSTYPTLEAERTSLGEKGIFFNFTEISHEDCDTMTFLVIFLRFDSFIVKSSTCGSRVSETWVTALSSRSSLGSSSWLSSQANCKNNSDRLKNKIPVHMLGALI